MIQSEIDEISEAFLDAWVEYFGQVMYYIKMKPTPESDIHPIYGESKNKKYAEEEKVLFHGTYKQDPIEEKGDIAGKVEKEFAEITFVTKELFDKGITECKSEDIIEITNRIGVTSRYNIFQHYGKVQLGNNRVFMKLKVVDIGG